MIHSGLRIIAGKWRSRRLHAPSADITRPMPDRVKGAVFDMLGSRFGTPGGLPPVQVLDLFAGSGSMGIEAVSRGAVGCMFVEQSARAVRVLRSNLDSLQAGPEMRVMSANAWTLPGRGSAEIGGPFGIVFVDPPYRFSRETEPGAKTPRLVNRVFDRALLTDDAVVVLHHEAAAHFDSAAGDHWAVSQRRQYGNTAITFLEWAVSGDGCAERPAGTQAATGTESGGDRDERTAGTRAATGAESAGGSGEQR